ncbi:methylmalonyl-CoA mutase, small subunit [Formosa agariphila KMM 3901]|uniref:Methylmalonyl-CoA mutase, small subunit n=1 Tax=Formosa agariphila (strain DSM 15362 / KCTC 12365 / LMG 23005 / KMM 3901 / M-2Alg 35-1) TaxID=1347342 RepID=T2KM35_FORAG|nr:methylmalonyl-CoA mutase subunit beta [Formosa agariphila]CDF79947.1 methylmalonyl-CoA mutase, small subunit [Formosa agariphila KMM 3901]
MSNTNLFEEFNSVSAKAWKQKIQFDLNGADYNKTLIWHSNDDINVKPFYTPDDLNTRNLKFKSPIGSFKITQSIYVNSENKSNSLANNAILDGAEAIDFIITNEHCDLDELLQNINLSIIPIYFDLQFCSSEFVEKLNQLALKTQAYFYVNFDIIGHLTKDGNWYNTLQSDFTALETVLKNCNNLKSNVCVNLDGYQNAGATITQQLAYGLAHVNEYLNQFPNLFKTEITFKLAVGSNYFFEISKFRALRTLWHTLATEYNLEPSCHIIAAPTKRNKTLYEYKTNIFRTTTECMSAILGGADSICNTAYDSLFHKKHTVGEQHAKDQLAALKAALNIGYEKNPAEGSYYIEYLTVQLAEKALVIFKDIEAQGGYLKLLKAGTIQKKIKESALKEQEQFDSGELTLIGANACIHSENRMKAELELYPFVKQNPRKTLIEPIIPKRLAETLEQHRLKSEI